MYPFATLPENLVAFCRSLRDDREFNIGPGEVHDAARAVDLLGVSEEGVVRNLLRPILSSTATEAAEFDRAFADFFFPGPAGVAQQALPDARRDPRKDERDERAARNRRETPTSTLDDESAGRRRAGLEPDDRAIAEADAVARATYSPLASRGDEERPELVSVDDGWIDAARLLVRRLHFGLSRRWSPARRGRRFDFRRTLRAATRTGGEPLAPRWLQRRRRTPRFVLLIDGSRSMAAYARAALALAVAIASATFRIEVFTFSTALQRVTGDVRRAAASRRGVLPHVEGAWGGGTRIGECLRAFLNRSADRLVTRDTVVVIASDGLDVGAPDTLDAAMRELRRRSAGIVWVNPLLDTPGYEPTATGMRIARAHVDTFTSVNDPVGLDRLARTIRLR